MPPALGTLERVDLRAAWASEAQHFTPWLASEAGLKLLGDTIGVELELEAEEHAVGPFRADILAKRTDTPEDHWVLIENQLERTDHTHLGQLLTYAAGLQAITIIWVAAGFTEEHRAALDWLNEITTERFEFFGLEMELWRISGSAPAPKFNVVCSPNDWRRSVKDRVRPPRVEGAITPTKEQQLRYWQGLRELLLERKGPVRPQRPLPQHWANFSLGRSATWLCATVNTRSGRIGVELDLNDLPGKPWFHHLLAQRTRIEIECGCALSWEELPGRRMSRIALYRPGTDPTDEGDWPQQHAWVADMLERFAAVFRPLVLTLPGGSETATAAPVPAVEEPVG